MLISNSSESPEERSTVRLVIIGASECLLPRDNPHTAGTTVVAAVAGFEDFRLAFVCIDLNAIARANIRFGEHLAFNQSVNLGHSNGCNSRAKEEARTGKSWRYRGARSYVVSHTPEERLTNGGFTREANGSPKPP